MQVQPYLCFEGRAEEAISYYQQVLGAECRFKMKFKDVPPSPGGEGCGSPEMTIDPEAVCHAELQIGESTVMLTDGAQVSERKGFQGITLTLSLSDDEEVDRLFAALESEGQALMPPSATFFASNFAMVADRFGVSWMLLTPLPVPVG